MTTEEEPTCSICYLNLIDAPQSELECHHKFHTTCIFTWFKNNNSCPLCRNNIIGEIKLEEDSKTRLEPLLNIQSNIFLIFDYLKDGQVSPIVERITQNMSTALPCDPRSFDKIHYIKRTDSNPATIFDTY